jgi:spermidine/putrescine-binding protein
MRVIALSMPKEGAQVSADMLGIPVDAPHPQNALRFIDYLLRQERMERLRGRFSSNQHSDNKDRAEPERPNLHTPGHASAALPIVNAADRETCWKTDARILAQSEGGDHRRDGILSGAAR